MTALRLSIIFNVFIIVVGRLFIEVFNNPTVTPWWSIGRCEFCGEWVNIFIRHGDLFSHILIAFSSVIFFWGVFVLFRNILEGN